MLLVAWLPIVAAAAACNDSVAWHKNREPAKDCAWVAETAARCGVRGTAGGPGIVEAVDACPRACGACDTTTNSAALTRIEARAATALAACGVAGERRPALVTCLDSYYGDSLAYWIAHSRRLGWSELVVLALDDAVRRAAAAAGACGVPFHGDVAPGRGDDPIPPLTGLAKFWVSAHLAAHGVAHVFSEMDVFHFGDALAPLRRAGWDDKKRGPALVAQRARRSLESNIGFYGVNPSNARGPDVANFFARARDAWRARLSENAGDGAEKAVDQTFFNRLANAASACVRHYGVASQALLDARRDAGRSFLRNCSERELPLLTTLDADVVTAGSDMAPSTVVWHIHRPNKTRVVRQLLSETYAGCCAAKLASLELKVAGARRCGLGEAPVNGSCRARYYLAPACAAEGVGDPDDRICDHLDAAWLPRMAALGHAARFDSSGATPAHTIAAPD